MSRAGETQEQIYYLAGPDLAALRRSPNLEAFRKRGVEVLLMYDRIDEWMLGSLREYAGKKLQNVAKGELPLDEADKQKRDEATKEAEPLLTRLKELLGDRVSEVRVSSRLTGSPSCLALADYDMAPHIARLMREVGQGMPQSKPTLEINPQHELLKRVETESDEARAKDLATLLLEQAEITAGAQLSDPASFVQRMNRVLLGT